MAAETSIHALDETGISIDPPRLPAQVDRRALGLADTAASGGGSIVGADTLQSGAPIGELGALPPRIGRFMVIRTLGAGGMGVVVEAYDPELDRKVAIKVLRSGRPGGDSQTRLLREAQAMARLSHPNVVQIYDVGPLGDGVFLAMELVRGQTLAAWLAAGRRGWHEVVAVFVDAARGLAAAHRAGLVHRDFKPDNVLIADDGRVRVADFGLAREERGADTLADNPGERGLLADTLTVTGVLMGTPMYMSPEQHRGAAAGPASDIFSFSVALFEGLWGRRPFAGDTLAELAKNVHAGALVPAPAGARVPAFVDAAVRRGLSPRPGDRFADFEAMIAALSRDPAASRRRALAGGGVGLAAIGVGALLLASRPAAPCEGGPARIAEVWGEGVRTTFNERFSPLPADERRAIEPRVRDGLTGYADAWATHHRGACLAHQAGDTSAPLFDAQMRCLEVRRQALAGAIEGIDGGDPASLRAAAMVVARLPPLAACEDTAALLAEVPPPADPEAAREVEALRQRLARAEVIGHGGRLDEAMRIAGEVRARGEALAYRPLVAEAWLAEGRAAVDASRPAEALEALTHAVLVATAARADAIAAEAEARRLYVDGVIFGRPGEALAAGPRAEAMIDRLDDRGDLRALLANTIGGVHLLAGDVDAARGRFASAVALAADDPRVDPIDHARGYLQNAALVADDPGEREALFVQASERLAEKLGPTHPATLRLQQSWADLTVDAAAARERQAAVCEGLLAQRAQGPFECAECAFGLAILEEELGRADAAAAAYAGVDRCFEPPAAAADEADAAMMAAQRALASAHARRLAGDPTATRTAVDEASARWQPLAGMWWFAPSLADLALLRGRALLDLGRAAEAVAPLAEAVAGLEAHLARDRRMGPRRLLARARAALAEALWAASEAGVEVGGASPDEARARALTLVDAASAHYREAGPGAASRLAELAAWDRRRGP